MIFGDKINNASDVISEFFPGGFDRMNDRVDEVPVSKENRGFKKKKFLIKEFLLFFSEFLVGNKIKDKERGFYDFNDEIADSGKKTEDPEEDTNRDF